jgi:hypothetical protein
MSKRTERVYYSNDLGGVIENYNTKARIETEEAVSAAEGGGCVTKDQDDQLTANAEHIGKMLQNAKGLISMLKRAGYKGPQLEAAKSCLYRLRLQQYKALAADKRLNENEHELKKQEEERLKAEDNAKNKSNSLDAGKDGKKYIKLELSKFEKRSLFDGLGFEFDKNLRLKKQLLNKQKGRAKMFFKERAEREM